LLQQPQPVQELVRRLAALSTAAHAAASCLVQHGENGRSSCDNVDRLYKDVQSALEKFSQLAQGKSWSLAKLSVDVNLQARHNRRRHGPICMGCVNVVGFYRGDEYLGAIRMLGRTFMEWRAGDLVSRFRRRWLGKPEQVLLTVDKIEGLMVHLKEPSDADRARAKNAQDLVDPGLPQGPRFVPPRARGDQ
jgi:hypothetical protein